MCVRARTIERRSTCDFDEKRLRLSVLSFACFLSHTGLPGAAFSHGRPPPPKSLAVTRAMRALRLLVLVLALALAPLHAHTGNYLRCVAFVPPRGFASRPPFPSVALRRSISAPTRVSGRYARGRSARTRPSRREHRLRRSHDASRATETRAPGPRSSLCPVATDAGRRTVSHMYHARQMGAARLQR